MTTVFLVTLKSILILSKFVGLIDISYTVEPTGLLVRNMNSTFLAILEIVRMIILLISTYLYLHQFYPIIHLLQVIDTIKFWIIIITARLSTIWTIRFINGIIQFDRKITPLLTNLFITHRSWSNKKWNWILITIFVYFIGFKSLSFYLFPMKIQNIVTPILIYPLLTPPFVLDYAIAISSCFFLQNMYARFQMLNDIWKCLPTGLVAISGRWTHNEIVGLMENTRLLHSELCELLNMFTLSYGPVLLSFYTSSFINMMICSFIVVNNETLLSTPSARNVWEINILLPLLFQVQIVMFLLSIIVFVSWINDERLKMISYLRLYQISNLHLDIKQQIKMFMNQISACDSDQISAFGFFDINLNLVTSILTLLISGLITMIQMKNQPFMLTINNDTNNLLNKL